MAKDISLLGANYPGVPAVELPQTGGGTATFYDIQVVDSLDSDSTTDALSANQGKTLRNMLVPTSYTGDLNDAGTGRFYCGTSVLNIPTTTTYIVDSLVYSTSHAVQVAYQRSGDHVFVRRKNSGTWYNWFELADSNHTTMGRTPVSITSDTDIIDWLPGMYTINDATASNSGYIPNKYGSLTVAPSSGVYGYCIFTALTSGTVYWRAFHKTNKTWYTSWQPLNADDLGAFASLSDFETALNTYGTSMIKGLRQIAANFSTASAPFSNLAYVGCITKTSNGNYQVKLNESKSNKVIVGSHTSSGWAWDELVLKSELVKTKTLQTPTTDANGCINTGLFASNGETPFAVSSNVGGGYVSTICGTFTGGEWIIQVKSLQTGEIIKNTQLNVDLAIKYF